MKKGGESNGNIGVYGKFRVIRLKSQNIAGFLEPAPILYRRRCAVRGPREG